MCYEATTDRLAPCDHAVCGRCARRWFLTKLTCPFCLRVPCALVDGRRPRLLERELVVRPGPIGLTMASPDGRVFAKGLTPGEAAHRAGLRAGDLITHVNNVPVRDHRGASSVIKSAEAEATAPLTLRVVPAARARLAACLPCLSPAC